MKKLILLTFFLNCCIFSGMSADSIDPIKKKEIKISIETKKDLR